MRFLLVILFILCSVVSATTYNMGILGKNGTEYDFMHEQDLTSATQDIFPDVRVPLLIGGTGASDSLTLQSTLGVGTSDYIKFAIGNNGATEAMRITNYLGDVAIGINETSPIYPLQVNGVLEAKDLYMNNANGSVAHNIFLDSIAGPTTVAIKSEGASYFLKNIGFGTNSPSTNSIVDMNIATKTFNPPRGTSSQRSALTPDESGIFYDMTVHTPYIYDGTSWISLLATGGYSDLVSGPIRSSSGVSAINAQTGTTDVFVMQVDPVITNTLEVQSESSSPVRGLTISNYDTSVYAPRLYLRKGRGTAASPSQALIGDTLGNILFTGTNDDGSESDQSASIKSNAEDDLTATTLGANLIFSTVPVSGDTITERMRITADGDVGIGTNAPAFKLAVAGQINSSTKITASESTGTTDGGFSFTQDGSQDTGMFSETDNQLDFYTAGTRRMRVLSSGNIGINAASPSYLFQVNGTLSSQDIYMNNATGSTEHYIYMDSMAGPTTVKIATNGTSYFKGGSVGFGVNPSTDAIVDMSVSDKGLLPPGGTTANKNALTAAESMMFYDSTLHEPFYYDGASWISMKQPTSSSVAWGAITGTLSSQTDLQGELDAKVGTSGNETISGTKTFSSTIAGDISGNANTVTSIPFLSGDVSNSGNVVTIGTAKVTNNMLAGSIDLTTKVSNILPIANGGTGSSSRNFVDLTSNETVAGTKTFSSTIHGDINGNAATVTTVPALSGDISTPGSTNVTTIGASKVTNAMLAGSIDLTTKVTGVLPVANGGVENLMTNGGFEGGNASGVGTGWTNAAGTATITTTSGEFTEGIQAQKVHLVSQTLDLHQYVSTTSTDAKEGYLSMCYKISSGCTTARICSVVDSTEVSCLSNLTKDSTWRCLDMPIWFGSTNAGLKVKTTGNVTCDFYTDKVRLTRTPNVAKGYTSVSNTYSALMTDTMIYADSTSGAFTITLPDIKSQYGKIITVKKMSDDFNAVQVVTTSAQNIDGDSYYYVYGKYEAMTFQSDGATWNIIGNYAPASGTFACGFGYGTAFGTVAADKMYCNREGKYLHARGYIKLGTATAGRGEITLPYTINSTMIPTTNVTTAAGTVIGDSGCESNAIHGTVTTAMGSATNIVYIGQSIVGTSNSIPTTTLSTACATGKMMKIEFSVPIAGW